jgi:hypothetical protein
MLAMSIHPFAIKPNPELKEIALTNGWTVYQSAQAANAEGPLSGIPLIFRCAMGRATGDFHTIAPKTEEKISQSRTFQQAHRIRICEPAF